MAYLVAVPDSNRRRGDRGRRNASVEEAARNRGFCERSDRRERAVRFRHGPQKQRAGHEVFGDCVFVDLRCFERRRPQRRHRSRAKVA